MFGLGGLRYAAANVDEARCDVSGDGPMWALLRRDPLRFVPQQPKQDPRDAV